MTKISAGRSLTFFSYFLIQAINLCVFKIQLQFFLTRVNLVPVLKHLRISNKSELVTNYLINCFQLNLHIKINKIHKISMIIDNCEQQWVFVAKVQLKCDVKWYVPPCVRIHPDKNITYHLIDFYQIWIIVCRCWKILRILLSHI